MTNNYVIGIQTFVKLDTLQKLVKSLFQCDGVDKYKIIFFIDSINNCLYKDRSRWIEKNRQVQQYLENIAQLHNVELYSPANNVGCYQGCQQLIDRCMNYSDYVIFLEDDVILGAKALLYYEHVYKQYLQFNTYSCIETVCSSTWRQHATPERILSIQNSNNRNSIFQNLEVINWLHSYEFAITKQAWSQYREIRGSPRGDVLLGYEFQKQKKYTILPSIGRSCRIGYNHTDGFSTYHNQVSNIPNNIIDMPESDCLLFDNVSIYNLIQNPC